MATMEFVLNGFTEFCKFSDKNSYPMTPIAPLSISCFIQTKDKNDTPPPPAFQMQVQNDTGREWLIRIRLIRSST